MSVPRPVVEGELQPRAIPFEYTYVTHTSFYPQSEEGSTDSGEVVEEQLVTFVSANTGLGTKAKSGNNAFSTGDSTLKTNIKDFFSRPVRISTINWGEFDTVGIKTTISPWQAWALNSYVKNKLNNYSFFRGNLKLRIQVTASPFYYGKVILSYQPLTAFKTSTITNDSGTRYFIPYSQRPHIVIEPGKADTYEMTLPFVYPANWLNIQSSQAMNDMGQLSFIIYSALQSANGVTGQAVTVAIYAWCDDIELSGASVGYAMQSDEFGEGSVSKPASWVARTAAYFENIPVIGPFATATKIGASAVSSIASLFGFTNVPVIADTSPMRSEPFPKLASSEIGFPVERLTLDPKNELSIDPRVVGIPSGTDEMSISHFMGRESWLTKINWDTADALDALMFYIRVNPLLYDNDGATQNKLYLTPMGYAANMFDAWRGDIIFRFHIVCSKYHKGKLLINFDPTGYSASNIGNTTVTSNVVFTQIVDIGETTNVEFRVPYQLATQFLTVRPALTAAEKGWAVKTAIPGTLPSSTLYDNGLLTIRVLNVLTAPVATSNVDIHVYVRGAENIELANPTDVDVNHVLSFYAPQSDEFTVEATGVHMELSTTSKTSENQYLVHFGENIKSFRALLRRYTFLSVEKSPSLGTSSQITTFYKNFYKMPMSPGFCSLGNYSAGKIVGVGLAPYNYVNFTPLAYLAQAFLAYRGSVNWTFDVSSYNPVKHLRVVKDNIHGYAAAVGATSNRADTIAAVAYTSLRNAGCAGQALVNQLTQSAVNVQVPNMSIFKFQSTDTLNANQGVTTDGSILDAFTLEGDSTFGASLDVNPPLIYSYVGAGTDFGLYFFLNVPTLWIYSSIPPPL